MKINCIHGYYKFSETSAGQMSRFMKRYGLQISRSGDHFTFADLVDAPKYAIKGGTYLGAPVTKTFEGEPWEIMRENSLCYDFNLGAVVPLASITQIVSPVSIGDSYFLNGLIQVGARTDAGKRVTDYSAFFDSTLGTFRYSEITCE